MANPLTDSVFSPPQTHEPRESPQLRPQEFSVDSSDLSTAYANFARLTGTPEELVLDFGLNIQVIANPGEPIKMVHRLVLDYYTAKRLLGALHWSVQQHENVYGVLEIDVQKRMK
jgi:hypothetical protein